ncbi:MAG: molybdate ABC transporter substrate-binding protein [Pirellulaceae bacterium]|nr:molybdate ABC transporter substrate-binding protein [Pirellulaceae bacterium]
MATACAQREPAPGITIFAAASSMDAVSEVLEAFEGEAVPVRANFASSSSLAMLLTRGVHADLFLSANEEWVDRVEDSVSVKCERKNLLGNALVLIAPIDSPLQVEQLAELSSPVIRRIAMADPFSVPAGIYARELLQEAGLWKELESRIAATADVRRALALVEQGAADVGVVYATDADISDGVKVLLELPASKTRVIYPLLRIENAGQDPAVKALFDYFDGEVAHRIFKQHGFQVLREGHQEQGIGN